jgi:N-hydroxyarylamine O-acetyltransferase
MERVGGDKRYKLINRRFLIESRDGRLAEERSIGSVDEFQKLLLETFNVAPPVPAGEIFVRVGS